jgi:quercetin dioxygenase-like cupin family protein
VMSNQTLTCLLALAASLILTLPRSSQGEETGHHPMGRNIAETKFEPVPGMPTCAPGAVLSGDPTKGPSIIIGKLSAGCSVPWHFHTPNEQLMMISGVAHVEVKDGKPITLRACGFAMMPSRHVHQLRCATTCTLFVHSDAAYDIHNVDAEGQEIPADEALPAAPKSAQDRRR